MGAATELAGCGFVLGNRAADLCEKLKEKRGTGFQMFQLFDSIPKGLWTGVV